MSWKRGEAAGFPGGKGAAGVAQQIICQMPPHTTYIEPFFGGGAVMWAKHPAGLNIGVDLDADAIAQARARIVGNDGTGSALAGYGEERSGIAECSEPAECADMAMPDCIAGNGTTAGTIASDGDTGRYEFYVGDGVAFLQTYPFHGNELAYCDPPYLHCTRRDHHRLYRYEMSDQQHEALLAILLRLPCMVCVSGYWSELYADTLRAPLWRVHSYTAQTRGGKVSEYLWCNYREPTALHDYRYLGRDFRERERIKRMKARWVKRLEKMPLLQRQALQAAIAHVDSDAGLYR